MNILHLLSWFPTPDDPTLGNFCIRQIESLPEECHSVILSVYADPKAEEAKVVEMKAERYTHVQVRFPAPRFPIEIVRKGWRKWRIYRLYQRGLDYVREHYFVPDLIHLHVAYPLGRIALRWHQRYQIPYLLTEHWTIYQPQNDALLQGRLRRRVVRIANAAGAILPVSDDLRRNMERVGVHNQFQVIYNVVDTSRFVSASPSSTDGKKRLLHISTLRDEAKNFSGLLRVMERMKEVRQDFELHVIHDYPAPDFEEFVRQHGLSDYVIFHGRQTSEGVARFFSQSDLFVLFSNFENLPCVIVESFASGVPVLSTDVGGIAEIVSSERGMLVHAGDEDALLSRLLYLLDHLDEYDTAAIRQYAVDTFSKEEIGGQIYRQYQKLLKVL